MMDLVLRGLDEDEEGVFGSRANGGLEANAAQGVDEVFELLRSFTWVCNRVTVSPLSPDQSLISERSIDYDSPAPL